MLILCDFDGTITTEDVTNLLWDRFGLPDWRARLLPKYRAGQSTTLELMDEGWRTIGLPKDELLAAARERITLREGFTEFVAACRERGWPLHVISCGIDWYLEAFLPEDVSFSAYTAVLEDGWRVRLRDGESLPPGADFKVDRLEELRARHPTHATVFIGDGRNDLPIAKACDRVFALRGSSLQRLCRRAGIHVEDFESFREVQVALTRKNAEAAAWQPPPVTSA
jgi:2-hydroxy-3-keto-5-methylthiopentenyl-1-phosphate phosphatase